MLIISLMLSNSSALIIVFAVLNALYLSRQNQMKSIERTRLLKPYEDSEYTPEIDKLKSEPSEYNEERAWVELGDRHPDFKYVL